MTSDAGLDPPIPESVPGAEEMFTSVFAGLDLLPKADVTTEEDNESRVLDSSGSSDTFK